jgi:hypothetical protein
MAGDRPLAAELRELIQDHLNLPEGHNLNIRGSLPLLREPFCCCYEEYLPNE